MYSHTLGFRVCRVWGLGFSLQGLGTLSSSLHCFHCRTSSLLRDLPIRKDGSISGLDVIRFFCKVFVFMRVSTRDAYSFWFQGFAVSGLRVSISELKGGSGS